MEVKAVGVKMLRDNLSRYLREVRSGVTVLVLDRDEVVAEIREPARRYSVAPGSTAADELANQGKLLRPSTSQRVLCRPSPVSLPRGTSRQLLDEDRADSSDTLR